MTTKPRKKTTPRKAKADAGPPTWAPEGLDEAAPNDALIRSAITQAVGSASVCWQHGDVPTGVFDDARALEIVDGLMAYIEAHPLTGPSA